MFLAPRRVAFLGDDAGLGKSRQLIEAARTRKYNRIVIFCPAIGRVSWRIQLETWGDPTWQVMDIADKYFQGPGAAVVLVSVQWLSDKTNRARAERYFRRNPVDLAIIDEGQFLKGKDAARTKAVYGGRLDLSGGVIAAAEPKAIWVASATFTPTNIGDFYPHLRALTPDLLCRLFQSSKPPSYTHFTDRFCEKKDDGFGLKIVGNNMSTIGELGGALRPILLARTKEQVLEDLPPIVAEPLFVRVSSKDEVREAVAQFKADPNSLSDDEFLEALARSYAAVESAERRRYMGVLKAQQAVSHAGAFLEANPGRKLVIFCHHRDVIHEVMCWAGADGYAPVAIEGSTSTRDRDAAVHAFQNDPATRVFAGQIRAASTSITLTAASRVLLIEPDPTPDVNYQAISRCHRLGQRDSVFAQFVMDDANPIERRAAKTLIRRATDNASFYGTDLRGVAQPGRQPNAH
ncbi:MAG: DEAD/DEAH box helicase [Pseudomonadota bacterium]